MIYSMIVVFITALIMYLFWSGYAWPLTKQFLLFVVWNFWKVTFFEMPRFAYKFVRCRFEVEKELMLPAIIFFITVIMSMLGWIISLTVSPAAFLFAVIGPALWLVARWYFVERHKTEGLEHVRGAQIVGSHELAKELEDD